MSQEASSSASQDWGRSESHPKCMHLLRCLCLGDDTRDWWRWSTELERSSIFELTIGSPNLRWDRLASLTRHLAKGYGLRINQ